MNFSEQMAVGKANRKRTVERQGSSSGDWFVSTEARFRAKYDPDLTPEDMHLGYNLEDTF